MEEPGFRKLLTEERPLSAVRPRYGFVAIDRARFLEQHDVPDEEAADLDAIVEAAGGGIRVIQPPPRQGLRAGGASVPQPATVVWDVPHSWLRAAG